LTSHVLREEFGGMSGRIQLWIALGVLVIVMLTAVVVATVYL
jgi:hypothetical protein